MKKYISILLLGFTSLFTAAAQPNTDEAVSILRKTSERLIALRTLRYHYAREVNDGKNNSSSKAAADCYIEFTGDSNMQVARFHLKSADRVQIFNGQEYFTLNEDDHTLAVEENVSADRFKSLSYFYNSIPALRSSLKTIVTDTSITKTVHDTLLNGKTYKLISVAMRNKSIGYLGGFQKFTQAVTIYYNLIIDPADLMLYQVLEHNSIDHQYHTKVTYSAINATPAVPPATSWFYSTYLAQYKRTVKRELRPLIAIGSLLPGWALPEYTPQKLSTVKSEGFKNKLVMIDFWIKNCGYCMESFPVLKQLEQRYRDKMQLLTVNAYDPIDDVKFFYNREKPTYKMLYNGRNLANQLGIAGYPTVLLINKEGKVIYSGLFDRAKIEAVIKDHI
jgi:thiol-disulfide isomerase/thioredoxin